MFFFSAGPKNSTALLHSSLVSFDQLMSSSSTVASTDGQGPHLYLIVVYDFEARGDVGSFGGLFLFGLPTLASIGASVLAVECSPDSASLYIPDALGSLQTFSDVFPTVYSDEQWSRLPSSATEFWAKNPEAFLALRDQGHRQVSILEFQLYMRLSALRFSKWIIDLQDAAKSKLGAEKVTLVFATDTATSDSKRLMAYLSNAEIYSPPYDFNANYNGVKEFDYTQLRSAIRLTGKVGEPDVKGKETPLVPVKRNHVASTDAIAQMYEVMWILLWATTEPADFEAYRMFWTMYVQTTGAPPPIFRPIWQNAPAQQLRNYMESL